MCDKERKKQKITQKHTRNIKKQQHGDGEFSIRMMSNKMKEERIAEEKQKHYVNNLQDNIKCEIKLFEAREDKNKSKKSK